MHHNTKDTVERHIANSLFERFSCAESTPTYQGALFELLGYSADTETAEKIPEGMFNPRDTEQATVVIFQEIARIWATIGTVEVSITVSPEDFEYYWKGVKERTSSSN